MTKELVRIPYSPIFGKPSPIVQIQLFRDHVQLYDRAYVDSGAWFSVFHGFVARRLGIEFARGQSLWALGMDGRRIPIFLHRLGLIVAGFHLTANVGFSDDLRIGFNVLGRDSIFDALQFCFNDRDHELTVSRL